MLLQPRRLFFRLIFDLLGWYGLLQVTARGGLLVRAYSSARTGSDGLYRVVSPDTLVRRHRSSMEPVYLSLSSSSLSLTA